MSKTFRTGTKRYQCPFHHAHRAAPRAESRITQDACASGHFTKHLDGTLLEADENGPFDELTSIKEFRSHLDTCAFEAAEVQDLAAKQAAFFTKYPDLAKEAAALVREAVDRVRTRDLDEVEEMVEGRLVAVSGLLTSPMRERLGWAAGSLMSTEDPAWVDFLNDCLCDFQIPSVPCRHGEKFPVETLRITFLRDDLKCQGAKLGEHSYRVWEKAFAAAAKMHSALEGTEKLREALHISGTRESAEADILHVFRKADADGNGSISLLELSTVLRELDSNMSYDKANAIFGAVDVDHNGSIEYEEFVAWLFC